MPNLYYLDERPIFDFERLLADAFNRGGKEEEERVRKDYAETQKLKTKQITERGGKLTEEGKLKRKEAFKKMMADMKDSKTDLISQHKELKAKWQSYPEGHQDKAYYGLKMKKIEELLKQDWYLKLNDDGIEITPEMGKAGLFTQKQFIADIEAKVRKEKQMQEMRQTE